MRKFITSIVISFCFLIVANAASTTAFTDVATSHKNYKAITYLQDQKIIEGYADNTFKPEQKVNRAEALKIIMLGSKIFVPEIQSQKIFPDVLYGAWYAKYISKAKNFEIVSGDGGTGLFRPGDTINLAEVLKILLKANNKKVISSKYDPYEDVPRDAWFAPYFKYAKGAKLLDGSSKDSVYPSMPVTRGMIAELMYRLATNTYVEPDGEASFYGAAFDGRSTASGEKFDMNAMTAAHRTYAFGTWLKVTNIANGKSVVVKVNDRGPYAENRIIDLSEAAFIKIATRSSGVAEVTLEVTSDPSYTTASTTPATTTPAVTTTTVTTTTPDPVTTPTTPVTTTASTSTSSTTSTTGDILNPSKVTCTNTQAISYASKTFFNNIDLSGETPSNILLNEVLILKGTTSSSEKKVTAFIVDSNSKQTAFSADIINGSFSVNVRFPEEGDFKLGILPGISGQSNFLKIKVLKNTCLAEEESSSLKPISNISINLKDGNTVVKWNGGDYNLFKVTFMQDGLKKSYILKNLNEWIPYYKEFASFGASNTTMYIRGAKITKKSILEENKITWSPVAKKDFMSTTHHEYLVNLEEINLTSLTKDAIKGDTIKVVFQAKTSVRSNAYVIFPNGKVGETTVTSTISSPSKNSKGIITFPASNASLETSYTTDENGVYFLEVNNDDGLAVINVPIYPRSVFPLIPNPRDISSQQIADIGVILSTAQKQMFDLVDADRKKFNVKPIVLDNKLSLLAQARCDDMVKNDYFGHWDSAGKSVDDIRMNYGVSTYVGENLSKDVNLQLAQYGLMRSAIHRSNILSTEWTRAGFGVSKLADGSYVFVQLFSTDPLKMDDVKTLRSQMLQSINTGRTATDLALKDNLSDLAQSWSQQMKDQDFFAFTNKSAVTLVDTVRNAGINSALGTYIMGNSSYTEALDQLKKNTQLQDAKWQNIGIGIVQDKYGVIKITLIYVE